MSDDMPPTPPLTMLGLVDDEPLFTSGLTMILDAQDDLSVRWQASQGREALHRLATEPVNVVLVDIQMPILDGIATTRRIVAEYPNTRVIIVTTFNTDRNLLAAIDAGASGFLLKNAAPNELIAGVRVVASGDSVASPGPTKQLFGIVAQHGELTVPGADRAEHRTINVLTERELDVFRLIAVGRTNAEICGDLALSMSTVKTHISNLLMKTGCRDRVQLVLLALRAGVVPLSEALGE